eukprot:scaffold54507_cov30-Tisochrysis_lutea.AAC.3
MTSSTTTTPQTLTDEVGASTAPGTLLFRWTVVEAFLASGISLQKVDEMRELFELAGHPLTHSSNLKEFIPKIRRKEVALVVAELQGQYFSISFDGTTRLGEVINVCARFIPSGFECVATRLIAVKTAAKHMNAVRLRGSFPKRKRASLRHQSNTQGHRSSGDSTRLPHARIARVRDEAREPHERTYITAPAPSTHTPPKGCLRVVSLRE